MANQWLTMGLACATLLTGNAFAQSPPPVYPVEQGGYHVPMFSNQYVTMLRVHIPPHSETDYHTHSNDLVNVTVDNYPAGSYSHPLGGVPNPPHHFKRGEVSYARYFSKPATHKAINPGKIAVDIVGVQLASPTPWGFTPETRDPRSYVQVVDNDRVRVWRLILKPGQTAAAINQGAPGVRIIVRGGHIAEINANGRDRRMLTEKGEFYWQEAGQTRSVRNLGMNEIELIEVELK